MKRPIHVTKHVRFERACMIGGEEVVLRSFAFVERVPALDGSTLTILRDRVEYVAQAWAAVPAALPGNVRGEYRRNCARPFADGRTADGIALITGRWDD